MRLRTKEDRVIVHVVNDTVSNHKTVEENIVACTSLQSQLQESHKSREKVINMCLAEATAKVAELKEARIKNESDIEVQKELNRHRKRLNEISYEVSVEETVQERSMRILKERCRRYVRF